MLLREALSLAAAAARVGRNYVNKTGPLRWLPYETRFYFGSSLTHRTFSLTYSFFSLFKGFSKFGESVVDIRHNVHDLHSKFYKERRNISSALF